MCEIPVVDLSDISGFANKTLRGDPDAFNRVYPSLCDAMRNVGIAYLVNHGIDLDIVDTLNATSKTFFDLPLEVKMKYGRPNLFEDRHGYTNGRFVDVEGTKARLFEAFDYNGAHALDETKYPMEIPGYKDAVDSFRLATNGLIKKLLTCLALGLDLEDPNYFIRQHQGSLDDTKITSFHNLKSLYYPPLCVPDITGKDYWRMAEHCDWGSISLIFQDAIGGLEAKMPVGEWVPVTPKPGSIVLNLGLMMDVWSGGHYRAIPHRVRLQCTTLARQCCAVFLAPDPEVRCKAIVPEKENWKSMYPHIDNETHTEYVTRVAAQIYHLNRKFGE